MTIVHAAERKHGLPPTASLQASSPEPPNYHGLRSFSWRRVVGITGAVAFPASVALYLGLHGSGWIPDVPNSLGQSSTATISPNAVSPGANASDVALNFSEAWVRHTNVTSKSWLNEMKPYITGNLAAEMTGVDPAGVPSSRLTGSPKVVSQKSSEAQVEISADTGRISLRMLRADGRWQVDAIDWEQV